MPVTLPTTRQVFSGAVSKLSFNRGRVQGRFLVTIGDRRVRTNLYVPSGVLARLGEIVPGRTRLYGEFRSGTFIVFGPDLRRAPETVTPVGPVAPGFVNGEISKLRERLNGRGKLYLIGRFGFADAAGKSQTKTLLVRGATALSLKSVLTDGPATVEGYVVGDVFEVTGLPRVEREPAQARAGGTRAEPAYQQILEGFWRQLKPHQIGKGLNREPVAGKTWVRGFARYKDKPLRPIETPAL